MNNKLYSEHMNELFKAVLSLKDESECYAFFEDLCTVTELKALAQRFQVAQMLKSGCQYTEIVEKTGASTATISRVNRSLLYGADGYLKVLERLDANK